MSSAAEEAARLIDAAAEQARAHLTAVGSPAAGADAGPTGAPDCGWCPLCRAAAFVRDTDPEIRARIVSSASMLVLALRDLAESATGPPRGPEQPHQPGTSGPAADEGDARP